MNDKPWWNLFLGVFLVGFLLWWGGTRTDQLKAGAVFYALLFVWIAFEIRSTFRHYRGEAAKRKATREERLVEAESRIAELERVARVDHPARYLVDGDGNLTDKPKR